MAGFLFDDEFGLTMEEDRECNCLSFTLRLGDLPSLLMPIFINDIVTFDHPYVLLKVIQV